MNKFKVGDRVIILDHDFLSGGFIKDIFNPNYYLIKLDVKAPNEYAYETDEVLMSPEFLKGI
jgi:hypothetical protein